MNNPIINEQLQDINSRIIADVLKTHGNTTINDKNNNWWLNQFINTNTSTTIESGTIATSYVPCPDYPNKNVKQYCKNCKFCQRIQSKPQQCKCSKHKNWELFDINNYLCGFYKNCYHKHKK